MKMQLTRFAMMTVAGLALAGASPTSEAAEQAEARMMNTDGGSVGVAC